MEQRKILLSVITLLFIVTAFFGFQYVRATQEVKRLQEEVKVQKINDRVVSFLDLFIQKVLKLDKEVPFEDRLRLENAIRDINDPEILVKWEQFTSASTETQIQASVKNLLEALVNKINY